jgi:hypothetical protein
MEQKPNFFSLYQTVGAMSAKIDALTVKLDGYIAESKKCDDDIVCRVRALETNDSVKKGERAVIGGLAGIIGSAITMALSWFFGGK